MSTRSDVGFCFKPGIIVPEFELIDDCFDTVIRDERGVLYYAEQVKWYDIGDNLVEQVERFMDTLNKDDYLYVNAYSGDYPEVEFDGDWFDNNFNLGGYTETRVTFEK